MYIIIILCYSKKKELIGGFSPMSDHMNIDTRTNQQFDQINSDVSTSKDLKLGSHSLRLFRGSDKSSEVMGKVPKGLPEATDSIQSKHTIKQTLSSAGDSIKNLFMRFVAFVKGEPAPSKKESKKETIDIPPTTEEFLSEFTEEARSVEHLTPRYVSQGKNDLLAKGTELLQSSEFKKLSTQDQTACKLTILETCKKALATEEQDIDDTISEAEEMSDLEGSSADSNESMSTFVNSVLGQPVTSVPPDTKDTATILDAAKNELQAMSLLQKGGASENVAKDITSLLGKLKNASADSSILFQLQSKFTEAGFHVSPKASLPSENAKILEARSNCIAQLASTYGFEVMKDLTIYTFHAEVAEIHTQNGGNFQSEFRGTSVASTLYRGLVTAEFPDLKEGGALFNAIGNIAADKTTTGTQKAEKIMDAMTQSFSNGSSNFKSLHNALLGPFTQLYAQKYEGPQDPRATKDAQTLATSMPLLRFLVPFIANKGQEQKDRTIGEASALLQNAANSKLLNKKPVDPTADPEEQKRQASASELREKENKFLQDVLFTKASAMRDAILQR